jgi:hypothetical protein
MRINAERRRRKADSLIGISVHQVVYISVERSSVQREIRVGGELLMFDSLRTSERLNPTNAACRINVTDDTVNGLTTR